MKEVDYKKIIEDMPIGYARHRIILGDQGRPLDYEYIEVNSSFELQTGLSRDVILGKRVTEVIPGIDKDGFDWIDFYGEVAQSGQPREVEQYSEPLKKWYKVKVNSPRKGEFITYVTDITDEKNEVQEKLNFLMASNDIVFEVDENYNYMDIIVENEETLFVPKKEILGKNIGYIFEDDFKVKILKALDSAKMSGKKETLVYSSILEGDNRWFYSEIKYIDSSSDPKFIIGVHDITEEKKLREKLLKSQEELEEFFEVNLDLLCIGSLDGKFVKVNRAWEEILGYSKDEIEGSMFADYIHPEDLESTKKLMENLESGGKVAGFTNRYRTKAGEYRYIEWRSNFKDGHIYAAARDISDSMESEKKLKRNEKMFKTVIDALPVRIFWKDLKLNYIGCNKLFANDAGLDFTEDVLGMSDYQLSWAEYAEDYRRDDFEVIKTGKSKLGFEEPVVDSAGNRRWVRTSKILLKNESEENVGIMGVFEDVTERKILENKLESEKEFLKTMLLSIGDGVISVGCDGKIRMINGIAEQLTGWDSLEAERQILSKVFELCEASDKAQKTDLVSLDFKTSGELKEGILKSRDGREYFVEYRFSHILDSNRDIEGTIMVFRDISSKKEKHERVLYLSYHDQLTGLYNRRFFEEEIKRLDQVRNLPISLMMLDANGLKLTNDAFGHEAGDKLLIRIAEVMKRSCRQDDIIARVGGDEFAIILSNASEEDAKALVERIYTESTKEDSAPVIVSISAGSGTKKSANENIEKALKRAEDEMYKRKLSESNAMREKTLEIITNRFFKTDMTGREHSESVSQIMGLFGEALGFEPEKVEELRTVGSVHDIGLIALDEKTINKSGKLSEREWEEIKRHPEFGYQILKSVNRMAPIAEYVLGHHERFDGKGYPKGLKGSEIPIEARMLTIVDAYDAMISDRSYKVKMNKKEAIEELKKNMGTQFDEELTRIFIDRVLK